MDDEDLEHLADAFATSSRALVGLAIRSIEAAPVPVTVPQHRVLVLLSGGPLAVGSIAEQLGVNPSNASRVCDRLQRLGLVSRTPSPVDGRAVQITITAEGRRVVREVMAHRRAEIREVLERLPRRTARSAIAAMDAFNRAAQEAGGPPRSAD